MWLTLIMLLISYFIQKRHGASSTKAALTAAAVGAGTYYVATETDWGRSVEKSIDDTWTQLFDKDGSAVTNADGSQATAPVGATVRKDAAGNIQRDANGNALFDLLNNTVSTTGSVLKSWGSTGTAAVIGTAAAATSDNKWMMWAGIGLAAILIMR